MGSKVPISGVIGVWPQRGVGSHVEYGNGQLLSVLESPIQIEHHLRAAGLPSPKYGDATRLPEMRRTTLLSRVRAMFDWLSDSVASYEVAVPNIERAIADTHAGNIKWSETSDSIYEGVSSIQERGSAGSQQNYRIEVAPDGHISYEYSRVVHGAAPPAPRNTVSAGQLTLGDVGKDRAIQEKLKVLEDAALLDAVGRVASDAQNQID